MEMAGLPKAVQGEFMLAFPVNGSPGRVRWPPGLVSPGRSVYPAHSFVPRPLKRLSMLSRNQFERPSGCSEPIPRDIPIDCILVKAFLVKRAFEYMIVRCAFNRPASMVEISMVCRRNRA